MHVKFPLFPGGKDDVAGASTADGVELEAWKRRWVGGLGVMGWGVMGNVLGRWVEG